MNHIERMRERFDRHGMVSTKDWAWIMKRMRLLEEIANAAQVHSSAQAILADALEAFDRSERNDADEEASR